MIISNSNRVGHFSGRNTYNWKFAGNKMGALRTRATLGRLFFRSSAAETDVTLHFYGPKKDEKKVKGILNKWAHRGYIANVTIPSRDISFSTLTLQVGWFRSSEINYLDTGTWVELKNSGGVRWDLSEVEFGTVRQITSADSKMKRRSVIVGSELREYITKYGLIWDWDYTAYNRSSRCIFRSFADVKFTTHFTGTFESWMRRNLCARTKATRIYPETSKWLVNKLTAL